MSLANVAPALQVRPKSAQSCLEISGDRLGWFSAVVRRHDVYCCLPYRPLRSNVQRVRGKVNGSVIAGRRTRSVRLMRQSAGIYEDDDQESEIEAEFAQSHSATKYIGYHARKQLAFDMWWLVLGLCKLCALLLSWRLV